MKKKTYNRNFLKKHFATDIHVSNDGEHAERDYFDKDSKTTKVHIYKIYREECGRAYIKTMKYGRLYLDYLVKTCFGGREPQDGKTYYPHHKDGDMRNSASSNLEWREETPATIAALEKLEREAWYKNRKITTNKKGVIRQGTHDLPIQFARYDPDLDWTYHFENPWIRYEEMNRWGGTDRHEIDVDKVFEDLGLVKGDKSQFATPVILHINNDYLDYSAHNLEWCDSYDQRYLDFKKIRHDRVMQMDHDSNYRLTESEWDVVYHGREPFQDWTDRPEKVLRRFS